MSHPLSPSDLAKIDAVLVFFRMGTCPVLPRSHVPDAVLDGLDAWYGSRDTYTAIPSDIAQPLGGPMGQPGYASFIPEGTDWFNRWAGARFDGGGDGVPSASAAQERS